MRNVWSSVDLELLKCGWYDCLLYIFRFQAVECFLANVKSTLINDPDTWEPQSIQFFEEFTQGL